MTWSPEMVLILILFLVGDATAHVVQFSMWRQIVTEMRGVRTRLDQVVQDRDEWRNVAQRSLLVLEKRQD